MSILIKGVQMPKDDWESIWIHPSGAVCYGGNFMLIKNAEAFTVPDHGDLIDAEEQMRLMRACEYDTYDDYCRAFDMLDNAPTIIPAERREDATN